MKQAVVMVGIGEMGGVFSRGILRLGHPLIPVTRDMAMQEVAQVWPEPQLVLVSVAENDLHPALANIPAVWHDRVALLQNELLPADWEKYGFNNPTVISVWFEKKKGQDARVLIPSPAFGPQADLLIDALATLDIPAYKLADADELRQELVIKNVYILTTNICGLVTGGDVADLWTNHQALAREVANEVIDIQQVLTGHDYNRERLIQGMLDGINGDLAHKCMGRSAPARLARALQLADAAGLAVPRMRAIHAGHIGKA